MLDAIIVGQVIQRVREEKRMSQELAVSYTHLRAKETGDNLG